MLAVKDSSTVMWKNHKKRRGTVLKVMMLQWTGREGKEAYVQMREGDQKTEVCPELGLFRMGQGSSSGFLC